LPVRLQNRQRAVAINGARLRRTASAVLSAVRNENTELSLLLVSDRRMRALNRRYRKKDRPTDVLAFPLTPPHPSHPEGEGVGGGAPSLQGRGKEKISSPPLRGRGVGEGEKPPVLLGDVVISMQTARRQAAELGHGLFDEVVRLLVHGVLHLLGYDHERSLRDAARMARKERAILRRIRQGNRWAY